MKPFTLLFAAALMLTACGGNPFVDTPPVDPTDPTDPDAPVTVDPKVAVDLRSVTYNPDGAGSLTMNIDGLAGNTANVPFVRNGSLDVAGYEAYTYQNRITQRSYIALVATNARTSLLATAVSDGGQSNRHMGGGSFARLDVFTKPTTGTFSYAGTYAGIFAPGDATSDLPPGLVANRPYRVQGDALVNASFVNSQVDGSVANRWLLDASGNRIDLNADGVVDDEDRLVDISFPRMDITANGQFLGDVEVSAAPDVPDSGSAIGTVNGVFGGAGATDVAGAIVINPIPGNNGIWEHGVFNLPRCGLAGESPLCNPTPLP
ncbi:hypothetical protein [Cypionkella sinensis]|uniref:Thymidylate synthase n=1 Tax=Cypionkella sinensis TaxID=1756043 RepID=A0ABV7ISH5_9RHOB